MQPFAKLFEYSDIGQVLVTLMLSEQNTLLLRIHFQPPGKGVSLYEQVYKIEDSVIARAAFNQLTQALAYEVVSLLIAETIPTSTH